MIKKQLVVLGYAAAVFCLISGQRRPEIFEPTFNREVYMGTECDVIRGRILVSGVLERLVEATGEIKVRIFPVKLEPTFNEVILDATFGEDFTLFNDSDNFTCSCDITNPSNQTSTVVTFVPLNDTSSDFQICLHRDGIFEKREKFSLRMQVIEATGNFADKSLLSYDDPLPIIFPVTVNIDDDPQDIVICCMESESQTEIEVKEGVNTSVIITSFCDGNFEREIDIAINCVEADTSGVDPAKVNAREDPDATYNSSFKFLYLPSEEKRVHASNSLNVSIIDDDSDSNDKPVEQFICSLLVGEGEKLRANRTCDRVTVNIEDNDQIFVSWTSKSYIFREDVISATTQLNSSDVFPTVQAVLTQSREITQAFAETQPDLSNFRFPSGVVLVDFMGVTYEVARSRRPGDPRNDFVTAQVTFNFDGSIQSENNFMLIDDNVCERDEIFAAFFPEDDDINVVEPDVTFIIIKDNDRAEISFSDDSYMVNENAGSIEVTVQSSIPITVGNTVVNITCLPGNASEMDFGGPYIYMPELFRSETNPASATFRVPITDDIIPEFTECFICEIISTDGPNCSVISNSSQAQICIKDNDDLVPVIIHNDTVVEGEKANILLELESLLDTDCNITVETTDGSARAPGDYVSGPYTVEIPARTKTAILMVMTNDDDIAELTETFTATIVDTCDLATPGNPSTGYVNILDNDMIDCSKASRSVTVNEGGRAQITVNCSGQYDFNFTLFLDTTNGSAVAPNDYTRGGYSLPFSGDQKSAILSVETASDSIAECDKHFQTTITRSSRPEKVNIVDPDTCDVVIEDSDILMVMFDPEDYEVSEGETADVMLVTNLPYSFNFSVDVACVNGSAFAPGDFIAQQYSVNFPSSPSNPGKASIAVHTLTDNVLEDAEFLECIILEVISDNDCAVLPRMQDMARVNITGNTNATVCFEPLRYQVIEGGSVTLTLVTDVIVQKSFSIMVTTMDGSAGSSDYVGGTMTVNFVVNSSTATVTYRTVDDTVREETEFFTAQLSVSAAMQAMGISVGDDCTATVEIVDNEALFVMLETTLCITPECDSVGGNAMLEVALVATTTCEQEYTVIVTASDVTAKEGGDYIGQSFSVTFPPSETRVPFNITILCDNIAELDEIFTLQLEAPQNMAGKCRDVQLGTPVRTNCTIEDEDTITCRKSPENATVTEGGVAELTVVCSGQSEFNFTLFLDTMDGSAVAPGDYTSGGYPLSFSAGQTSSVLSVSTLDDTIAELDEFFKVMITGSDTPDKVIIGNPDTCFVTIQDNDVITCSKAPGNVTVTEGGVANLTVNCSGEYEFDFTLFLDTMNGSAVAPGDYTSGGYSLSFSAGQTSSVLSVSTSDNTIAELDEFFKVMITGSDTPDKVIIGDPDTCFVIIQDNEVVTCRKVSENATVTEGGVANLTVECSGQTDFDFTLLIFTMDGSAVGPNDYNSGLYVLSFTAGQTSGMISVPTRNDNIAECEEFFKVMINHIVPGKVLIGDPRTCYVTIEDDDAVQINFAETQYTVTEGQQERLNMNITGCVSSKCSVYVNVSGGNALVSSDFTGVPKQLEVQPSIIQLDFPFKAICDNITEGVEYVELALEIPSQNVCRIEAIAPTTTRVNILDSCKDPIPEVSAIPVNDSVIADPLYTVPLRTMNTSNIIEGTPLCYEVHGRPNHYFNLVSDDCTSVNAHYVAAVRPRAGNVISQIGIVTSDRSNRCHRIQIDVSSDGQCQTLIDGSNITGTTNTTSTGVNIMAGLHYVRVSTLNCIEQDLVMWIRCHITTLNRTGDSFNQSMIKFVVARGLQTRSEAHGLIGQFWGVPVNVTQYTGGLLPSAQTHSGDFYTLHFNAASPSQRRTFTAKLGWTTWRLNYIPTLPGFKCFYAGNSQGGPSIEATDPGVQDSVIEGNYKDYMASGLFDTQWHDEFSRFTAECNP